MLNVKLKLKKSTIWKLPSVHQRESLLFKLNYVGTIWVSNDGKCDFSREQFCKVKYYVIAISILLIQNFCFLFIFKRLKVILIKRHCVMTEFLCNWALYVTGSTMRRTSFRVINELFWDWVFSIFDLNIGRSFKTFFLRNIKVFILYQLQYQNKGFETSDSKIQNLSKKFCHRMKIHKIRYKNCKLETEGAALPLIN